MIILGSHSPRKRLPLWFASLLLLLFLHLFLSLLFLLVHSHRLLLGGFAPLLPQVLSGSHQHVGWVELIPEDEQNNFDILLNLLMFIYMIRYNDMTCYAKI